MTDTVVQFSDETIEQRINPSPVVEGHDSQNTAIKIIQRWRKILSLRWLIFIALLGAAAVWGLTVADPSPWRFIASCGYSVGVLIPSFILYYLRAANDD